MVGGPLQECGFHTAGGIVPRFGSADRVRGQGPRMCSWDLTKKERSLSVNSAIKLNLITESSTGLGFHTMGIYGMNY